MDAASALRTARSRQHLSQRALDRRTGTPQPSLARIESGSEDPTVARLNRILAGAEAQLTLLPTRTPTVAAWAAELAELASGDPAGIPKALVVISDGLRNADRPLRVALCVTPPARTGVEHVDALLAALVEWTLTSDGLPVPAWVYEPDRVATVPWDLIPHMAVRESLRSRTPEPFARRNVYVPPEFFDSV